MKALFINPPTWFNMFPPLALPIIAGYLESLNHNVTVLDLNIEFFYYIFSDKFLDKFFVIWNTLKEEIRGVNYNQCEKIDNIKKKIEIYNYINNYCKETGYEIEKTKQYCLDYGNISKNKDKYFDAWAVKIIHFKIIIFNEILLKLQLIYADLFDDFINDCIKKIIGFEAEYIGFSMSDVDQFFYSVRIAKEIKKQVSTPICFGGTCINYFYEQKIKNKVAFHKQVADFVMFGAGEIPHSDMANYIDGKKDISEVRNIEYLDKFGNLKHNKTKIVGIIPKYYTKYDNFDFSKYYTPEMVLSIETTKGCYWSKCAFCTRPMLHEGIMIRKPDDVVDDLANLNKKFNVKYFHLMDDCIPVEYAKNLAQRILDKNLKIYYMTFMRFEESMTKEFLQKMYDSGLRLIIWGLESPYQKRLNFINKGIQIKTAQRILKDATNIGIKNNVTLIIDFPNETEKELNYTKNFIRDYSDDIYFVQIHQFQLLKDTLMFANPQKYKISKDLVNRTEKNGYAKNTITDKYEHIIENTGIDSMKKGAPPACLYTTGGSLLYAMRDKIV